jgi:molecular chaperone DnaK (HSP70)
MTALYSVGIDLGTTNSVVAYTRLDAELAPGELPALSLLAIPQLVGPNQIESR